MDTREDNESSLKSSLTAIEGPGDPHTKSPAGGDDRARGAATVEGSKGLERAQHREDGGGG